MTNSFEEMYAKSTTIDFLRQVTLLFAYVLTIFGTISIVDLIIYLKEMIFQLN